MRIIWSDKMGFILKQAPIEMTQVQLGQQHMDDLVQDW